MAVGGGGANSNDPADVVKAFAQAAKDNDGKAMCEMMSAQSKKGLEDFTSGKSCEEAATENEGTDGPRIDPSKLEITNTEINGDTAKVTTKLEGEESTLTLVKEDGKWRIDLFSDLPKMPDPSDMPTVDPPTFDPPTFDSPTP